MLQLIIIVISALLGAFEQNQSMGNPGCGGVRPHAWLLMNWAAVAMMVAVLLTVVKIGNLIIEAKWGLSHKKTVLQT